MAPRTLRVRARGTASVPNHEAEEAGVRRFIGRKFTEVEPGRFGFVPTNEDEEVPVRSEYLKAIKDGDLWAADRDTADQAAVPFDPMFGDEKSAAQQAATRPSIAPAKG